MLADELTWLDEHVNLEATAGKVEGLSLERMRSLVRFLGDPQDSYPVIHLTGTNGKGSTAQLITRLLTEAGLTVGTYASPHLERINERIARNGEPIEDDELASLLEDLRRIEPELGGRSSYFELLTGAALKWFADVAVDVAVVEVGLLGRYDATNVCDATVAVVTNVGHDHTDGGPRWRERIAEEKSGIVKPESTLVLGELDPNLLPIFYGAGAREVWERERDFDCEANELAVGGRLLELRTPGARYEEVFLSLHGAHQGVNAACALAAAEAFFNAPLSQEIVETAFGNVTMPGRFEIVGHEPLIIIDGAHNPDGAVVAAATLHDDFSVNGDLIIVTGMLSPRDPRALLDALEAEEASVVIASTAPSPRAVPPSDIAAAAESIGTDAIIEPDIGSALTRAKRLAGPDDVILVTGSLWFIGAARGLLMSRA